MRAICLAIALVGASAASAADYGTPEACSLYVKNVELAPLPDDGRAYFFDGTELIGADWTCNVQTGACESEGSTEKVTFSIELTDRAASISGSDGQTFTLPRCD